MPNIAFILNGEIARVARKQIRSEMAALRNASSTQRSEIAALKRQAAALEKQAKALSRIHAKSKRVAGNNAALGAVRFSAKGLASQRKRPDLSAENRGAIVGASGHAIYNWESGKARPRDAYLGAIAKLKSLGKKQVAQMLARRKGQVAAD